MTKRTEIDDEDFGSSLAQAIILAECGDTIVVHRESDKSFGESMVQRHRPGIKLNFVVELLASQPPPPQ